MTESPHRYFKVSAEAYSGVENYVNTSRSYPTETTQRGLQVFDDLPKDKSDGWGLIAIDDWRFDSEDEVVIADLVTSGKAGEMEKGAWMSKAFPDPPEPEPEPDFPTP